MPLLDGGQPHRLEHPPAGVPPSASVWVIRFTGELFSDYECAA